MRQVGFETAASGPCVDWSVSEANLAEADVRLPRPISDVDIQDTDPETGHSTKESLLDERERIAEIAEQAAARVRSGALVEGL